MLTNKKSLLEYVLTPVAPLFKHVNPNALTLLGSIPSILFFVFIVNKWYLLALVAFFGSLFDAVDGLVARKYNKVTKFGGVLDSTFDRVADFLIISAFAFGGLVRWEIVAPLLGVSFLTSYIRSRGELANPDVSFAVGIIERTERLSLVIVGLFLYMIFPQFIFNGLNTAEIIFLLLFVLSLYTVSQRLIHAYKKL